MKAEEILEKLVAFRTINDPLNKVFPDKGIINFVEGLLREWNPEFVVKRFETEHYTSIYFAPSLDSPVELLFMGHLDVVPVAEGWDSNPFQIVVDSGRLYGRGAKDCKGSVVSALMMFQQLFSERNDTTNRLGLFLSMDEESGGQYGAGKFFEWLKEKKIQPRNVINVDGGPQVVYKRRAGFGVKLFVPAMIQKTTGEKVERTFTSRILVDNSRHSAYFVKGVDTHAVLYLSKYLHINKSSKLINIDGDWVKGNVIPDCVIVEMLEPSKKIATEEIEYDENLTNIIRNLRSLPLLQLSTTSSSEFGVTVNPNIIYYTKEKGTTIYLDVRAFLNGDDRDRLVSAIEDRLGALKKITKVECLGTSGFFCTDLDARLVKVASGVLEKYSLNSQPCEQEGASDARYAGKIPVIDLGPRGGNVHGSNEYIVLKSMIEFSEIYRDISLVLCSD